MDRNQAEHLARIRHLRESFAEANERLVARLRAADHAAGAHAPDGGGWSAAQIGAHVAMVTTRFAGMMTGDLPGTAPLPAEFRERAWTEIAAAIPARLNAPANTHPPSGVTCAAAIASLEAAGQRFAHALDQVTPERGARHGLVHAVVGSISVYQIGEWAVAHVKRHNKQAKQVLGG